MRDYNLGLVLGRFQTLTTGHELILRRALRLCDRVVVYIGSADKSGTERNPFSYELRKSLIESAFEWEAFSKRIDVLPLDDLGAGDNPIWGEYVLSSFKRDCGRLPDLYVTGCERERPSWFTNGMAPDMDELRICRSTDAVSATKCRELMRAGERDRWEALTPKATWSRFDEMKSILDSIKER